jgi:hypothetical protein
VAASRVARRSFSVCPGVGDTSVALTEKDVGFACGQGTFSEIRRVAVAVPLALLRFGRPPDSLIRGEAGSSRQVGTRLTAAPAWRAARPLQLHQRNTVCRHAGFRRSVRHSNRCRTG